MMRGFLLQAIAHPCTNNKQADAHKRSRAWAAHHLPHKTSGACRSGVKWSGVSGGRDSDRNERSAMECSEGWRNGASHQLTGS
ncbi:MAG: hypothetical protein LH679_05100 [Cyanobacteria bacterium CAN_BIN43]|nr:hypothetical protein [Cyanobacteria bacterium CAN_BIN43]